MNVGQSHIQGSPPRSMNVPTFTPSPSSRGSQKGKSAPDVSETIIDLEDDFALSSISLASPKKPAPFSSSYSSSYQTEEKKDDGHHPVQKKPSWRRSLGLGGSGGIQGQLPQGGQEEQRSSEPRPWPYLKDGRQASKDSSKTLTEGVVLFANPYKLTLDMAPHSVYGVPAPQNTGNKDPTSRSSYPYLLHNLSPTSTALEGPPRPPPGTPSAAPGISLSGKRYVDPRKRNKGRKEAFKTGKVLFSNERTFIHWIKFGMLLGALAMTLLNFSGEGVQRSVADQELARRAGMIGQSVGVGLIVICMLCLAYSTAIFHYRHMGVVRKQNDDRYFDRIGPTALTIGLFVAYALNVFLTLQVTSKMDPNYQPISLYNNHHTVGNTPFRPTPPMPTPAVFDTPRLLPGSTILVDDEDDEEDMDMDMDDMPPSLPQTQSLATDNQPSTQSSPGPAPAANAGVQPHRGPSTQSHVDNADDEDEDEEE